LARADWDRYQETLKRSQLENATEQKPQKASEGYTATESLPPTSSNFDDPPRRRWFG